MSRRKPVRRRLGLMVLGASAVAIFALTVAACGGKSDPEPTAVPAGPGPGGTFGSLGNLDAEALSACMEAAGFEFDPASNAGQDGAGFGFGGPRGGSGPNGDPDQIAALQDCAAEQGATFGDGTPPAGFSGGGAGSFDPSTVVQCLQDVGIDVEDTTDAGNLPALLQSLDAADATVQTAIQSCLGPGFGGATQ